MQKKEAIAPIFKNGGELHNFVDERQSHLKKKWTQNKNRTLEDAVYLLINGGNFFFCVSDSSGKPPDFSSGDLKRIARPTQEGTPKFSN